VTITDTNGVAIGITGIKISGSGFTQTNNCRTTLAAGANCTIEVTVNVTSAGTYSGTLSITESAGALHQVPLSAVGTNE